MDDELFGAWRRVVEPGDTGVVLGDVTVGGLSRRRLNRLRGAPGHRAACAGRGRPQCAVRPGLRLGRTIPRCSNR